MDVPFRIGMQIVLLRLALLAVVLVRHLCVFQYSHTAAMLPDAAAIAGYEERARVFGLCLARGKGVTQWQTGIVLLTANTSRHFLLFAGVFFDIVAGFDVFLCLGGQGSLAAARLVAGVLAGEGVGCGGFRDVGASSTSVLSSR